MYCTVLRPPTNTKYNLNIETKTEGEDKEVEK